jgi:hypothetical protein
MINQPFVLEGVRRAGVRVRHAEAIGVGFVVLVGAAACAHVSTNPTQSPGAPASSIGSDVSATAQSGALQSQSSLAGCPGGNGIHISVNSGMASSGGSSTNALSAANTGSGISVAVDQRNSIDTTIVFDVAHKTWTRTNLAAAITAGLADNARGGYAICAGITALIPSANLTINGARGRVHFAATLQSLLNSIQSGTAGTTSQLRRM